MTKLGIGELIHVESWLGGRFPRAFRWRGRRHTVRLVESDPAGAPLREGEQMDHRTYSLRTSSGLSCVLVHDRRLGTWSMKQVLTRREGG
jgi:hypothetical protein